MFSGIIENLGNLRDKTPQSEGFAMTFTTDLPTQEIKIGDSIAVNGCCLTVTALDAGQFSVFVSHETLARTNLADLRPQTTVNLERAMQLSQRLDGHLVQGHVEATGMLKAKHQMGESCEIEVRLPEDLKALVVPKGSIALDGISLTVNWLREENKGLVIGVNLIPHTLQKTTLGAKVAGDKINIETDILGRYVQRFMQAYSRG